jgi:hypothetical protein
MIEFTLPGISFWLALRENLFYFYAILGLIFFVYHYKKLNSIPKTALLTLSFLFFFMGLWELPLFLLGSNQGLIWILYLVLYMIPFPVVCYVLKTKFNFTEKEFTLLLFLVFFSIIFSDVLNYLFSFNPSLWNYGVSYLNRAVTFTFLFYIFKNISFPSIQSKTNLNYLLVLILPLSILTTASIYKASQKIVYQNIFPGPLFEVIIGSIYVLWILYSTLTFLNYLKENIKNVR